MKNGLHHAELPVLQMMGVKCVHANPANPGSVNRYRLIVSDGAGTHPFAMLATSLNGMYEDGELTDFCIFEVGSYVPSNVNKNGPNDK